MTGVHRSAVYRCGRVCGAGRPAAGAGEWPLSRLLPELVDPDARARPHGKHHRGAGRRTCLRLPTRRSRIAAPCRSLFNHLAPFSRSARSWSKRSADRWRFWKKRSPGCSGNPLRARRLHDPQRPSATGAEPATAVRHCSTVEYDVGSQDSQGDEVGRSARRMDEAHQARQGEGAVTSHRWR